MFNELLLGKEKENTKTREDKRIGQNSIISKLPFLGIYLKKINTFIFYT
jgi:hypothetical protein